MAEVIITAIALKLLESLVMFLMLRRLFYAYIIAADEAAALIKIEKLLQNGFNITSDPLGEFTNKPEKIPGIVVGYMLHIKKLGLLKAKYPEREISVAVKLSRVGLNVEKSRGNLETSLALIVKLAEKYKIFVWVDAEKKKDWELTLQTVLAVKRRGCGNIGMAIQSVHSNSKKTAKTLAANRVTVRIVKGAYRDGDIKTPGKINKNFLDLFITAHTQYKQTNCIAVGTHDEILLNEIKNRSDARSFQYQFLYGVRTKLQEEFLKQEFNVLIYVPWGSFRNALGFFLRRLREGIKLNALMLFFRNISEARIFQKKYGLR